MIKYDITEKGYCAKPPHDSYKVLEIKGFEPQLMGKYQELLSQKHDLDCAAACSNQTLFQKDTSLIDGALINSAIQLLVKCFTQSGKDDRMKFDYMKAFKKYALESYQEDLSQIYLKFYNMRNKVISHDELNYSNNIVGISIDTDGNACDITELTVATHYVYEQNKTLLLRLLSIATSYCSDQLENMKKILMEKYNALILSEIDSNRLSEFGAFNRW